MALSDYEKQVLAQMEQQLASDDPQFVSKLQGGKAKAGAPNPRQIAWGVVLLLVGMAALLAGVAFSSASTVMMFVGPAIGVAGFVAMVLGVHQVISGLSGNPRAARKRPAKLAGGFMSKQEDRWDRRQP